MPIDSKIRLPVLACSRKLDLGAITVIERDSANFELFVKYPKLFETFRKLECDRVHIHPRFQLDFDFKAHRDIGTSTSEVLRLHEVTHAIRPSRNLLQNLYRKPDRRLARAVLSDQ